MLGVVYHSQGRFQDAEEAFENALKLNPRYTEAALNLSVTYNDRGKYERAREVYTRAVSASVGQPNALDWFARGKLANMHADLGAAYTGLAMFDEAVREYGKALDLCPDFADLRVRLGNAVSRHGHVARRGHRVRARERLRPDFVPARIHLGVTLFSLGKKDAAIAEWNGGAQLEPDNKSAKALHPDVQRRARPTPRLGATALISGGFWYAIRVRVRRARDLQECGGHFTAARDRRRVARRCTAGS